MNTIPSGVMSVLMFGISYSFVLPIMLCIIFKKRFRAHIKPFFLGILAYGAFSFCLVNIINGILINFVDTSGFNTALIFIYSLCMQIVSVLLTQCGKYYILRVLKNDPTPDKYALRGDALEFGAGFAFLESFLTVGLTMLSYLAYAFLMTSGQAQVMIDSVSGPQQQSVAQIFEMLAVTPVYDYIGSILQGVAFFLFQIGSSLLVFRSVFGDGAGDKAYFRLAILLHVIMVIPGCFYTAGMVKSPWFPTIITLIFGAATLVYSYDKLKEYEKQHLKDMATSKKGKKTIHLK